MARLALVPSPFTRAAAWRPVAERLAGAVAVDYGDLPADDPYGAVAARVADAMGEGAWIAVLHSGAGGFAPALAEAGAAGLIFVDAVRPHPGRSLRDVEPDFVAWLAARASDGRLESWSRWFDEDPLPRLLPDPAMREAFVADLPRPPLTFLDAPPPVTDSWEHLPAAYLQLSGRYAGQADWAEARGWPVERLDLHHLAMASHPSEIAQALARLVVASVDDPTPLASNLAF